MKGLRLLIAVFLVAALAGCSGGEKGAAGDKGAADKGAAVQPGGDKAPAGDKAAGGDATFDVCVKEYTSMVQRKTQGNAAPPAEVVAKAADTSCTVCKTDNVACKVVVDQLKKQ